MAYIVAGAMTDSSEQWARSMETVTAGETARIGGAIYRTDNQGRKVTLSGT